jgi:hypothetical protein
MIRVLGGDAAKYAAPSVSPRKPSRQLAGGARKQPARHGERSEFQKELFGCHRWPISMFGLMPGIEQ